MSTLLTWLPIIHFVGFALAIGAATVKVWLVLKCRSDVSWIPVFVRFAPIITRQILIGMILITLTGITWLATGYDFSPMLIAKIILFGSIWVLGPIIDNVVEPKFRRLAPAAGETATVEFSRAQAQYVIIEIIATLMFYVVLVMWMLR